MRFFLFFLFFYFSTSNFTNFYKKFFNSKGNNVLFSNNIRLNLDKIPYKNYLIIKKFDIVNFNFKQKPKIHKNFSAYYTDSEIANIKTEEKLTLKNSRFIEEENNDIYNNNSSFRENEKNHFSNNFKQIVNNLEKNKKPSVDLNIFGDY